MKRFLVGDLVTGGNMGPVILYSGVPTLSIDVPTMPQIVAKLGPRDVGMVVGVLRDYVVIVVNGVVGVTMSRIIEHL